VTEGPHCPKCGRHDRWEYYAGPNDNPDALRCETIVINANIGDHCGYIYWRRNAPATEPTSKEAAAASRAKYEADQAAMAAEVALHDRHARVRALVLAMISSNQSPDKFDTDWCSLLDKIKRNQVTQAAAAAESIRIRSKSIVTIACELDEQIEAVTNIQGRDS
jgi:hypothetical protein